MHPAKPLAAALLCCSFAANAASMAPPDVPQAVAVPNGHKAAMTLKGVGQLTYECRAKADAYGAHEWVFVGPDATLQDTSGKAVGKYYGGPTWEHNEGGKITGKQLAVAPGTPGAIPLQLVQAAPAVGSGTLQGRELHSARENDGRRRAESDLRRFDSRQPADRRLLGGLRVL